MSLARTVFLDRIKNLQLSFSNPSLADLPPSSTTIDHNNVAKILRNGMAVIGFVTLEDFLISRTKEALAELSSYGINFNDLPDELRFRTTVQALTAINRLVNFEETKEDKIQFVQNSSLKVSSTLNSSYSLIEIAFGHHNSNLNDKEIKEILKSYKMDDPWGQMNNISSRIGLTALPLDNSFKNAAERRHKAAHTLNANTPITDLTGFIKEALGIAIAFDSLTATSLHLFKTHNHDYIHGNKKIMASDVTLSQVKMDSSKWKYKKETHLRATKSNIDRALIESFARNQASINFETLILYNSSNEIVDWACNY
ncbi:MAG: hypothetical protein KF732_00580 [Flavobacteriales bacterium]|nr:hypothetical protein [Flavobacteriales bacterium]